MLPLAFNLERCPVLVIGAGRVGATKATQLLEAGATVTVIASEIRAALPVAADRIVERPYRFGDLLGFRLVISAVGDQEVNDQIVEEARQRQIWVNVVDDPLRSEFYFTALHRTGNVVISVTTEGSSPALARELRDRCAQSIPAHVGDVARQLRAEREAIHRSGSGTEGIDWQSRIRLLLDSDAPPSGD